MLTRLPAKLAKNGMRVKTSAYVYMYMSGLRLCQVSRYMYMSGLRLCQVSRYMYMSGLRLCQVSRYMYMSGLRLCQVSRYVYMYLDTRPKLSLPVLICQFQLPVNNFF